MEWICPTEPQEGKDFDMGKIKLGNPQVKEWVVDVNYPTAVKTMAKCVDDALLLVKKQVITFGSEGDINYRDYYDCICCLAAALFAEVNKNKKTKT